jgi:subtilisin family serine protease
VSVLARILLAAAPILAALSAPSAAARAPARPVRVAVIDSGVVRTPALAALIEREIDMVDGRPAYTAVSDHGTAVATLVAATSHVPVSIISLRVDAIGICDPHACEMETYAIASAIREAIELKVDVINMSIDLTFDPSIYLALEKAAGKGIRIVVAAGNQGGEPRGMIYARSMPKRLWLVGATDDKGALAAFSARPEDAANCQFVWRQGVDVETQNRAGERVYGSGTSMAAPIMTAQLADDIGARRR